MCQFGEPPRNGAQGGKKAAAGGSTVYSVAACTKYIVYIKVRKRGRERERGERGAGRERGRDRGRERGREVKVRGGREQEFRQNQITNDTKDYINRPSF